jgi:predicted esterase
MDDMREPIGHRSRSERNAEVTRREFLAAAGVLALGACNGTSEEPLVQGDPRLTARPSLTRPKTITAGIHRVSPNGNDLVAYVPASALARDAMPVIVFLHGAFRTVETFVEAHRPIADETGVIVLAPYALENTWDAIYSTFGVDVERIDDALTWLFNGLPINPAAIALSGFSDGASYTLSLGRANGDLFSRLVAYSPGFMIPVTSVGKPPIAISHGRQDAVLPFANARDRIVPALVTAGYAVDFRPFDGGHAVLLSLVTDTMQALAAL